MAETYYKIKGSTLSDIADVIRLQKQSDKKYKPEEFADVLKAVIVIPDKEAVSDPFSLTFGESTAVGELCTGYGVETAKSTFTIEFSESIIETELT